MTIDPALVEKLVCPATRTRLRYDEARQELISDEAGIAYPVRGGVPVLLVENIVYPHARFEQAVRRKVDSTNQIFREVFAALKKEGMKNLYYLPAEHLIGDDGEATVDGVHPTDLGFMRLARRIEEKLKKILKLK